MIRLLQYQQICAIAEIPVMAAGNINRMEDVKKLLYAGCAKVVLNFSKESNILLLEEVSKRFGKEKWSSVFLLWKNLQITKN